MCVVKKQRYPDNVYQPSIGVYQSRPRIIFISCLSNKGNGLYFVVVALPVPVVFYSYLDAFITLY